jgi:hypothetical protein
MKLLPLLLLTALPAALPAAQQWAPPEEPDASTILQEAQADARAGRHELALAKHVWYHENALKFDQGQGGVRLSFALSAWLELANDYPPALVALKQARDAALERSLKGPSGVSAFHDFASINRTLGEDRLTRDVFVRLDAENSAMGRVLFQIAEPALLKEKDYALCLKYLKPREAFLRALSTYRMNRELAADKQFGEHLADYADKSFSNGVATIVGLLAVSGRTDEAEQIARDAKKEWKDASFHAAIEHALRGNVPAPWP